MTDDHTPPVPFPMPPHTSAVSPADAAPSVPPPADSRMSQAGPSAIPQFPMPPLTNRARAGVGNSPLIYMPPPPPPGAPEMVTPDGKLNENEATMILRATLLPEHRKDANILKFISNYMRCRNAAQAAREAGLESRAGNYLRNRPDIHECITRMTEKSVMKYGYDVTDVVERVKEISAMDPIEFENEDGSYKTRMKDIAPESRRAIKKFKVKNLFGKDPNGMDCKIGEIIEVELYDKMEALRLLGREKEVFKDTSVVQHDVTSRMADILLDSKRRADDHARELSEKTIDVTPIKGET